MTETATLPFRGIAEPTPRTIPYYDGVVHGMGVEIPVGRIPPLTQSWMDKMGANLGRYPIELPPFGAIFETRWNVEMDSGPPQSLDVAVHAMPLASPGGPLGDYFQPVIEGLRAIAPDLKTTKRALLCGLFVRMEDSTYCGPFAIVAARCYEDGTLAYIRTGGESPQTVIPMARYLTTNEPTLAEYGDFLYRNYATHILAVPLMAQRLVVWK